VSSAFYIPGYRTYERMSQLVNPSPSRLWVLMDEREESINDCQLLVSLEGYDPYSPGALRIIDYPAAYHNKAASLSFADGHAELRRWRDPRTAPLPKPGQLIPLNGPSPNNPDVTWLQARTSARLGR
jgi:prepilin-type processing-associated H-X9-DG protein